MGLTVFLVCLESDSRDARTAISPTVSSTPGQGCHGGSTQWGFMGFNGFIWVLRGSILGLYDFIWVYINRINNLQYPRLLSSLMAILEENPMEKGLWFQTNWGEIRWTQWMVSPQDLPFTPWDSEDPVSCAWFFSFPGHHTFQQQIVFVELPPHVGWITCPKHICPVGMMVGWWAHRVPSNRPSSLGEIPNQQLHMPRTPHITRISTLPDRRPPVRIQ